MPELPPAVEIVSILLGLIVALRRLLGAARPILFGLLPDKVQPYVAALLTVLPALADQLGVATTHLDIAETLVVAASVFFIAVRGKPTEAGPAALLLVAAFGLSLPACSAVEPPHSAAEALVEAQRVCAAYALAPPEARTDELDAACAEIAGICGEVP